jgi:predicted CopG family antitoxin
MRKLTTISISYDNYNMLKKMGGTRDSFNDVLTKVLKKVKVVNEESDSNVENTL